MIQPVQKTRLIGAFSGAYMDRALYIVMTLRRLKPYALRKVSVERRGVTFENLRLFLSEFHPAWHLTARTANVCMDAETDPEGLPGFQWKHRH